MASRKRRRYRRGVDLAIALLKTVARRDTACRAGEVAALLRIPRASMHRIVRALEDYQLLSVPRRGWIALGETCGALGERFEANARREDDRIVRRQPARTSVGVVGYGLLRDRHACRLAPAFQARPSRKFRIGFANASLDSPWRTALVHAVEFAAAKHADIVADLLVRNAMHDARQQLLDVGSLIEARVDGLIISAVDCGVLAPAIAQAAGHGIPTVLVDRVATDASTHASAVACDNWAIGATMARWLAEHIQGRGGVLLLPGEEGAEPAKGRLDGARSVLSEFPEIEVFGVHWTGWKRSAGAEVMRAAIADRGPDIAGVWCDSGLQAAGSLAAWIEARGRKGGIPPHTGGDLNLTYKLALRHNVPLAGVNYPPAMGLRALEVLLDLLRARSAPARVNVPTEVVITRGHSTASVRPNVWADDHVRWDLPDELILATGLGSSYNPRAFRVHYGGNRYNRSAASPIEMRHAG